MHARDTSTWKLGAGESEMKVRSVAVEFMFYLHNGWYVRGMMLEEGLEKDGLGLQEKRFLTK